MNRSLCLLTLFFSFLSSTTINIPEDYSTIQAGIDASEDGDTVLIDQGTYFENLILEKEIVLTSLAINDDLDSDWINNENINETIISGAQEPFDPNKGSCLIIRNGDIEPTIIGLTFQDGLGTSILETVCDVQHQKRSGGAILIYEAYPTIIYNRFLNNGFYNDFGGGYNQINGGVAEGGAISHYDTDDVEFDEDRNSSSQNNSSSRTIPGTLNIQNNYFEGNSSGDGENFYSHGYGGLIDVSYSIFDDIDCANNSVNEYVLKSREYVADYIQNGITGNCIEGNSFYVSVDGDDNNPGTESDPLKTIGHALSLVKDDETSTTIHIREGVYSPSTNGEIFPIVLPDNIHLIGENSETSKINAEANSIKQSRVFIIEDCDNIRIEHLTISGGYHTTGGCIGGGGILIGSPEFIYNNSNPILENLIIEENYSTKGAGIFVSLESSVQIKNTKIINNSIGPDPTGDYWQPSGGGICFFYASGILDKILIRNNVGHLVHVSAGIASQSSEISINRTTITQNINSSGIYGVPGVGNESSVTIVNSLIHENDLPDIMGNFQNSTLFYSAIDNLNSDVEYGEGSFNISDEMIVTDDDGFTLIPNSVCIDAGTADIDGDGNDDITDYNGPAPDMGVYESALFAPSGFQLIPQESYVELAWEPIYNDDFQYYLLERSTDLEFADNVVSTYLASNYYEDHELEYDTEYFYRVSYYTGGWSEYSDVLSVTLEWLDVDGVQLPTVYALYQNYPNPFNPITNLRYDLPRNSFVEITVYDMLGNVIRNLVNQNKSSGSKTVQWNAINNQGEPVSAGVYLYKIQAGDFVDTRKMILLK